MDFDVGLIDHRWERLQIEKAQSLHVVPFASLSAIMNAGRLIEYLIIPRFPLGAWGTIELKQSTDRNRHPPTAQSESKPERSEQPLRRCLHGPARSGVIGWAQENLSEPQGRILNLFEGS